MRVLVAVLMLSACVSTPQKPQSPPSAPMVPCKDDKPRLEARSRELQEIVRADQADRENWQSKTPEQMLEMAKRDVPRRERVGQIFGEGCFSKAADYAAAALVYQHGDVPDHFYQTFIWARRAVELGDAHQRRLACMGIDRYLVNTGRKQIFATQANKTADSDCYCLDQVEKSFPDKRRKEESGRSLKEALAWVAGLNEGKSCPNSECKEALEATPKGSLPGYW